MTARARLLPFICGSLENPTRFFQFLRKLRFFAIHAIFCQSASAELGDVVLQGPDDGSLVSQIGAMYGFCPLVASSKNSIFLGGRNCVKQLFFYALVFLAMQTIYTFFYRPTQTLPNLLPLLFGADHQRHVEKHRDGTRLFEVPWNRERLKYTVLANLDPLIYRNCIENACEW
jgi:hypothetical protein